LPDAFFASLDRAAYSGSSTDTLEQLESAPSRRQNQLNFAPMRLSLLKRRRLAHCVSRSSLRWPVRLYLMRTQTVRTPPSPHRIPVEISPSHRAGRFPVSRTSTATLRSRKSRSRSTASSRRAARQSLTSRRRRGSNSRSFSSSDGRSSKSRTCSRCVFSSTVPSRFASLVQTSV
jgi:hypothetical protein